MSQQFNIKFKTLSRLKGFSQNCIKTIALQNTEEEGLVFRSPKKKNDSKLISAPNVRGDFHIHITMQHVILKIF